MPDQRRTFFEAAAFFLALAERIRDDQWASPGLGVWSVRELVAHTGLAFANAEREITTLAQPSVPDGGAPSTAVEFYERGMAMPGVNERVAQRGREAAEALEDDPIPSIRALEVRVHDLLARTPDEIVIATPFASLPLPEYLLTKTFELVVHTLDLAAALDLAVEPPAAPLAECLSMALSLAARRERADAVALLRALTGRAPLRSDFTIL
jgi:uncharacterized protein (TIGR03083 family)